MSKYDDYEKSSGDTFEKFKNHKKTNSKHPHKKVKPREKARAAKYY
jgi:hypothetical protein